MLFNWVVLGFAVSILLSGPVHAEEKFGGKTEMNGISREKYKNFETEWKLVTVRYREDSGEMRWTYANDIAWNTLSKGGGKYVDGAVFAKVGIATEKDTKFLSSRVPSGTRRVQYMVYDSKKYAQTDGWGYALFNQAGVTFPEDPKVTTVSCHACHRIVPERGFVFSQISTKDSWQPSAPTAISKLTYGSKLDIQASTKPVKQLPDFLRQNIPAEFSQVREIKGPFSDHLFDGTLDEVRPLLVQEAFTSGMPAILISADSALYSLVYPLRKADDLVCDPKQKKFGSITTLKLATDRIRKDSSGSESVLKIGRFCFTVN